MISEKLGIMGDRETQAKRKHEVLIRNSARASRRRKAQACRGEQGVQWGQVPEGEPYNTRLARAKRARSVETNQVPQGIMDTY